jgi:hypothetical protein
VVVYPDTYEAGGDLERFTLDGQKLVTNRVIDHWYEAEYEYVKLLDEDERIYVIKRRKTDRWELEGVYPP